MEEHFAATWKSINTIPVIYIEGDVTNDAEDKLFACFKTIEENEKDRLLINFEKTLYINSAGIAVIISLFNSAREKNWQVSFCSLSPHFRKVMNIVGLTDFVEIYDDMEKALQA